MIDNNKIEVTYSDLLDQQKFVAETLDYCILEKHIALLQILALVGNSGISVFDLFKKEHAFYTPNFGNLLGYNLKQIEEEGQRYWDSKIHPEDYRGLMNAAISIFKLFHRFSSDEKSNYKLINEYRILNAEGNYTRVIEQHQILELDSFGNLWLSLSIIDVSPNQEVDDLFKSQLLNFRTGKIIPFQEEITKGNVNTSIVLTTREAQILQMVKDGFLSKEISDKLAISVHTVNTHRQRFLEKLGANNSMEAVIFASKLGLL